jgi:hypothetical protein
MEYMMFTIEDLIKKTVGGYSFTFVHVNYEGYKEFLENVLIYVLCQECAYKR